jgi:hypothetical protein
MIKTEKNITHHLVNNEENKSLSRASSLKTSKLNLARIQFSESSNEKLKNKESNLDLNTLENVSEKDNLIKLKHDNEDNIKISILNLNNSLQTARNKGYLKNISYKEKLFEQIANKELEEMQEKENKITESNSKEVDKSFEEQQINDIQEFLLNDIIQDPIFSEIIMFKENKKEQDIEMPKINFYSLKNNNSGFSETTMNEKTENIETYKNTELNEINSASSEQKMLQMLKDNPPTNKLHISEADEKGGVIYAIKTNLDTIVEYVDLLIQIISENFYEFVLMKANWLKKNVHLIQQIYKNEFISNKWNENDLKSIGYSSQYIKEIQSQKNKTDNINNSDSKRIKENLNHDKENDQTNFNNSTNFSFYWKKPTINEDKENKISLKLSKTTEKIGGHLEKPYCILTRAIFESLATRIFSSYTHSTIDPKLLSIQRIFHRSIFDTFNESFSEFLFRLKEFNLYSEEIHILKKKELNLEDLHYCLLKAKVLVIEKASEVVGMVPNSEESMLRRFRIIF